MNKKPKRFINGPFYPWLSEMGNSEAMRRLRKSSDAISVLTMFMNKYTKQNDGRNLSITYSEAAPFMSASTFAKAKLRCQAFGFLYCRQYGRLERNASVYDLIGKWQWLSCQPEKLDRIEGLLERHTRTLRIPAAKIKPKKINGQAVGGGVRKKGLLRSIEQRMLGMTNEP